MKITLSDINNSDVLSLIKIISQIQIGDYSIFDNTIKVERLSDINFNIQVLSEPEDEPDTVLFGEI